MAGEFSRARIGINAVQIGHIFSGTYRYVSRLLEYLPQVAPETEFFVFTARDNAAHFLTNSQDHIHTVTLPLQSRHRLRRTILEQVYLNQAVRNHQIDLLLCPRDVIPLFPPCKTVLGVLSQHMNARHRDVSGLPLHMALYHRIAIGSSARRADQVFCISAASRRYLLEDIGEQYGDKISVVHLGVDEEWLADFQENSGETPQLAHLLTKPYILFVSALHPHKNVRNLLLAFPEVLGKFPDLSLVITGRDVNGEQHRLQMLANELGIARQVHFTGAVSNQELRALYARSRAFVFPSKIEGFGLTVLEAMASGAPVICSNRTSLPEVLGDAGILFDPDQINEISAGIIKMLTDTPFQQRCIEQGKKRASTFTWRRCAEQIVSILHRAL